MTADTIGGFVLLAILSGCSDVNAGTLANFGKRGTSGQLTAAPHPNFLAASHEPPRWIGDSIHAEQRPTACIRNHIALRRKRSSAMKRLLFSCCALALFGTAEAQAQEYCQPGYPADVARNQYVPGVPCGDAGAIGASLYVSPRPVPPMVGHTFITYEGLMPDQLLYQHQRTYYRPHGPYGGVTQTNINWGYRSRLHPFGHYHEWGYAFAGLREKLRIHPNPQEKLLHLQKHGYANGGADCYTGGGTVVPTGNCPSGNCNQAQQVPTQQNAVQQAFAQTPAQKTAARK